MSDMTEAPSLKERDRDHQPNPPISNMNLLADISVGLSVEVGSASLTFAELLDLGEGRVVELDRQANDLLDILVNGKLIAKGEIVEVNGRYGVRVVDVVAPDRRLTGMEGRS